MDIYLTEISSGDRLRIPLLPDRLNIRTGAVATTLNIIKAGEARIPRGTIATGYSWNGVFPSEARTIKDSFNDQRVARAQQPDTPADNRPFDQRRRVH